MSSLTDLEQGAQLYNAGDVDALVDLYTEDATLVTPVGTLEGRAAIRESGAAKKPPSRTAP